MDSEIRTATVDDLERINNVYNSYIVGKNTSFDTEPWSMKARIAWFEKYRQGEQYQVLVAASDHRTIGFAASSPFRSKTAYDSSVETTVVLEESATGQGLGTDLLAELLARIRPTGVHRRTR